LLELAGSARAVVTVEDGVAERGIGAALTVGLAQRATVTSPAPVARTLGVSQTFIPHAKRDAILAAEGLDAPGIADSIEAVLRSTASGQQGDGRRSDQPCSAQRAAGRRVVGTGGEHDRLALGHVERVLGVRSAGAVVGPLGPAIRLV